MPLAALVREQLSPSPTAFSISRHFRAFRPHASNLEGDLIVFNEEEYHCDMAQCLGDGDPLTAKETGEEMSNESLEIEDEDIQRDTRSSTTRSGRK